MIRRILTVAVLAGAASAAAVPAGAQPGPGPLAGLISARICRAGGGFPLFAPFEKVGPVRTGTCLGGDYALAAVRVPKSGARHLSLV